MVVSVVMMHFNPKKKKKLYEENLTQLEEEKIERAVCCFFRFDQFKMYAVLASSGTPTRLQMSRDEHNRN